MKKILLSLVLALSIANLFGAPRYWVGGATGSWAATSSWSTTSGGTSGAAVPVTADDVIFDGNGGNGGVYTVTAIPNQIINTLTVSGTSTTVNFQSNSFTAVTLQIANGNASGYDLTVAAGCTLNLDGSTMSLTGGSTTSASTTVTVDNTTGLLAGMAITGTGIPMSATVSSVTNATTFVLSANATATNTSQTYQVLGIYKLIIRMNQNATADISGNLVFSNGIQQFDVISYTGASITFESGATCTTALSCLSANSSSNYNFKNTNPADVARVIFKSGSAYYFKGGNTIVPTSNLGTSTAPTVPLVQFQSGSTYYHQSLLSNTYNLPLQPGAITLGTGAPVITRTFGDFVYDYNGAFACTFGGVASQTNGVTFDNFIVKQGSFALTSANTSGAHSNFTINKDIQIADGSTFNINGNTGQSTNFNLIMAGTLNQQIYGGASGPLNTGILQLGNLAVLKVNNNSTAPAITLKNVLSLNSTTASVTSTVGVIDASTNNTAALKLNISGITISSNPAFSSSTFSNLIINGAAETLGTPITVTNNLNFLSGKLTLGTNDLTIGASGSISGASASNYIVTNSTGKLNLPAAAGNNTLIPIGFSSTSYDPVTVNPASATTFSASVSTTLSGSPASGIQYNGKEWNLSSTNPSVTTLSLTPFAVTATGTYPIIGVYGGSSYTNSAATLTSGTYTANFSSFGAFVTGTSDTATALQATETNGIQIFAQNSILTINGLNSGDAVSVYRSNGQLVKSFISNSSQNVTSLPSGIYVIKAITEKGSCIQKVIL